MKEESRCFLRPVGWEDVNLLFSWANDKKVRENSFSQKPIGYKEHCAWFKKKYQEKDSQIYIFCEGKDEKGMLRLDFSGNEAEISYSIAPKERQKGYGEKLILLAEEMICQKLKDTGGGLDTERACPMAIAKARVKEENLASNRIFTKLGYEKCESGYEKKLPLDIGEAMHTSEK